MMSFVPKDFKPPHSVTPHIVFTHEEGYYDATIYIDHVAVAYFDYTSGGISLLPFEVGTSDKVFNDDSQAVEYLKSRGFKLTKKKDVNRGKGFYIYTIKINK